MQTHGGQTAEDAILSRERYFKHTLLVDWDGDGSWDHPLTDMSQYVKNTSRDQALTSTAPSELLLAEGYAAAALNLTAAGEYNGVPLSSHFAPYNGLSIFYSQGLQLGVDMTYSISVWTVNGWVEYPQFTGVIRGVDTDRATGEVSIECLDNAEKLRTPVNLPAFALWENHLQAGYKRGQLVDSSSVIDLAARSGGFTAGPKGMSWPGANFFEILSVPYHGSILPEIGLLDADQGIHKTELWENGTDPQKARKEAYRAGPHGYLARNAVPAGSDLNYQKFWTEDTADVGLGGSPFTTFVLGGWFYWSGPNVDADTTAIRLMIRGHRFELALENSNGSCLPRFYRATSYPNDGWNVGANLPSGTWEAPVDGDYSAGAGTIGWHYYEIAIKWYLDPGDIWMRATIDNNRGNSVLAANRAPSQFNDRFSGMVWVHNTWAASDVKIWQATGYPDLGTIAYDATPKNAAIFPSEDGWGRNRITHTVREKGLEAWTLAKDVAAAEYGAVFFDEAGRFNFWNYDSVQKRKNTVVRSWTVDDIGSMSFRYATDAIRNVWVVTTKAGRATWDVAYDMADDGVPLVKNGNEYIPAIFNIPWGAIKEFFFVPRDTTIAVNPWRAPNVEGYWESDIPRHGRQTWSDTTWRPDVSDETEQKFQTRDRVRFAVWNTEADADKAWSIGFVNPEGSARFRLEGYEVTEEDPKTWIIRDETSIATYGERVIELKDNDWLQDEWQTRAMLTNIIQKTSKPIPVTDDIEAPGDPRIQIGDTVEIYDPLGMGENIRLQILGIKRDFDPEKGLKDTYQVEVVVPPREGYWDSQTYGYWDQSFIWT